MLYVSLVLLFLKEIEQRSILFTTGTRDIEVERSHVDPEATMFFAKNWDGVST